MPTSEPLQKEVPHHDKEMLDETPKSCSRVYNVNDVRYHRLNDADINPEFKNDEEFEQDKESQSARRKSYEAFVMTGDRMINLAKTPANNDFRSKHHKHDIEPIPLLDNECASLPSSPTSIDSPESKIKNKQSAYSNKIANEQDYEEGYFELTDQSGSDSNVVKLRTQPPRNRSAVR